MDPNMQVQATVRACAACCAQQGRSGSAGLNARARSTQTSRSQLSENRVPERVLCCCCRNF